MAFYADLHIHSKYSRATSKDCDLKHLAYWARKKGIAVVGTGDFTHPVWIAELKEQLVPAEPGLFRLKPDLEKEVSAIAASLPQSDRGREAAMAFYADLHIHSKYSRATSKDCDLKHLAYWARKKGIAVVGTGDFTHPVWIAELKEQLVPAEPGLFRLKPDLEKEVSAMLPPACQGTTRFMLSVEISTIYKKGEKTRKIHHLLYAPDFPSAERIIQSLSKIGNLKSDGRPILGLDSRHLLEITLESGPGSYLVPAHIWTPWFAALGSKSGFDAIDECYADLAAHIFAVETGLSSDPEMNWRVSSLDRFRLVSNSDAHSPQKLGREACVFDTELDYFAIRTALETGHGYEGTLEFFPEEGKYHLDGHRNCNVRLLPNETKQLGGRQVRSGSQARDRESVQSRLDSGGSLSIQ